jgi:glycosyltransferase involved in cell wall biosynthesis
MTSSVLFLSHDPHEVHSAFAQSVGAREYCTGLKKYVALTKKIPWTGHFFAPYSFVYSLFIKVPEDILLIDGGASVYIALGLKWRKPGLKIIYLDGDTMFHSVRNAKPYQQYLAAKLLKNIDAVISVSEQNQSQVTIDAPGAVCPPFPKAVVATNSPHKSCGLYVGRLDPDKNIRQIIAFGLQCPDFETFVVVGDGVLRPEIEKMAQANPKLQYKGFVTDVASYYNTCSFLIHLPDYDPHPTVTMEAALCGCFPIMSPGTGSNYLFDPLFTAPDPADFAALNKKIAYIQKHNHAVSLLLKESIDKIPTRESSVAHFTHSFTQLAKQLRS